jgi:hypothetical protein
MYTRQYPWKTGESLEKAVRHINQPPTDIQELVPDIDPQVARAIMKGLERSPDDRWPTVAMMVQQLREGESRRQSGRDAKKRLSERPS